MLHLLLSLAFAGEPVVLPGSAESVVFEDDVAGEVRAALADLEAGKLEEAARELGALADAGGGPVLRFLEALALYEAGEVRPAEVAVIEVLQADPAFGAAANLHGLLLADLGRGDEAMASLDRALSTARADDDEPLMVRALVNIGVVHEDRGALESAGRVWKEALAVAKAAAMHTEVGAIQQRLESLKRGRQSDVVGAVSDKLRRGDRSGAKSLAAAADGATRRQRIRKAIAAAAIARADGALDVAGARLADALREAEGAALLREAEAARLELARVWMLSGRLDDAAAALDTGIGKLERTSLSVRLADVRLLRGRVAARMSDLPRARAELSAVQTLTASLGHPDLASQVDELAGSVALAAGDEAGAASAWGRAAAAHEVSGHWMDAARLHAERTRALAASGASADEAVAAAEAAFARAAEPLGPAHIRISRALGLVDAEQLDAALADFVAAAELARSVGGSRGEAVAAVAEANAAEALVVLGHDRDALGGGEQDLVARHGSFMDARQAYEAGRSAFDDRRYAAAASSFEQALASFDRLGEAEPAKRTRLALGWALWNQASSSAPETARPLFERARELGEASGDADLVRRSKVGGAVAAGRLQRPDAVLRLKQAIRAVSGEPELEARCHAALAELTSLSLGQRADAARAALGLDASPGTMYAVEAVVVAAIRAGEYALARDLAAAGSQVNWKGQENLQQLEEQARSLASGG
jgi:tetratricopeptide (TPR) repeat protein